MTVTPVSYTHLDVYKRQVHEAASTFYAGEKVRVPEIRVSHIAVSYTHLDVYKRQAPSHTGILGITIRPKAYCGRSASSVFRLAAAEMS